jgi:oligoribonuclease NrnB/cAMP/cGMP phosphodiesterase (DHH superfamily)
MLSEEQLAEIRSSLESSSNPLFLFDNDVDGFCSFLILRRALDRGRGVAIKSFPDLSGQYLRKLDEMSPDHVFILDKAEVSAEFIDGAVERGIPITWIDHHESKTDPELIKKTSYYNSLPTAEPTTYLAQKIFCKKEDRWLAMIGCIGDVYMPEFAGEFEKEFPELFSPGLAAFEALYKTEVGKLVRMLDFGLMDTITNVVSLTKYLFNAKGPYDILEENPRTRHLHQRYNELNDFYKKQAEKAEKGFNDEDPFLVFTYSGNMSMSSQISNLLVFNHPDKLVVVGFKRPEKVNISIRGKNALKVTLEAIKGIEGATGGGHKSATGAMVPIDDWEKFVERVKELVESKHF